MLTVQRLQNWNKNELFRKFFASPEKFTQVHLRGIVTEPTILELRSNQCFVCNFLSMPRCQG